MFNTINFKYKNTYFSPNDDKPTPTPTPLLDDPEEPVTRHPVPRIVKPDGSIVRKLKDGTAGLKATGKTIAETLGTEKKVHTISEAIVNSTLYK